MGGRSQNGCARCCMKFVQWLPVLFIVLIVAWSYYAYVYSLCIVLVTSIAVKSKRLRTSHLCFPVAFLIMYHIFLILFAWSYAKCILEEPLSPPREFLFTNEDWELLHNVNSAEQDKSSIMEQLVIKRNLPVYMVGNDGNINACLTCGLIKPDRAHHCSTCGKCILQMDHHCPWTNNCVGFHNHKYFIVFLGWGAIYCFYIVASSGPYFADFWTFTGDLSVDRFQVMFLFIVAVMFGICQAGLGGYHVYLAARNQTTLETYATPKFRNGPPDNRAFDLGRKANLQEMFGTNCCLAILPVRTTLGDGVHWRYRSAPSDLPLLENGGHVSPVPLANSF
ncbi:Palmitoyltransferase [Fasciola hepatica]|uniref:Palmitoyltransferase n=1 Tax=Fasciola hepatica TaxID=6192 RepID=A0A4E0R7S1_FASHE|nr:Palmitoyltransferase [Fasciola hepatica]